MPARAKVLRDGTIGREETLSLAGRFELLHAPLPLACRLVRVLRAIIEIAMLAMFYPWEELSLGGPIALQFIGNDHPWYIHQPFEELAEELLRGPLIPAALDQDIQHVPGLIHRPPEIVTLALNRQKHLIHVPLVAGPSASAPELIGILLAKLAAPLADRLIGHDDSAFKQELFDIAKTQAEPEVQPYGMADDLCREAVVLIVVGGWWGAHAENMSHYEQNAQAARQVDNAPPRVPDALQQRKNAFH